MESVPKSAGLLSSVFFFQTTWFASVTRFVSGQSCFGNPIVYANFPNALTSCTVYNSVAPQRGNKTQKLLLTSTHFLGEGLFAISLIFLTYYSPFSLISLSLSSLPSSHFSHRRVAADSPPPSPPSWPPGGSCFPGCRKPSQTCHLPRFPFLLTSALPVLFLYSPAWLFFCRLGKLGNVARRSSSEGGGKLSYKLRLRRRRRIPARAYPWEKQRRDEKK